MSNDKVAATFHPDEQARIAAARGKRQEPAAAAPDTSVAPNPVQHLDERSAPHAHEHLDES